MTTCNHTLALPEISQLHQNLSSALNSLDQFVENIHEDHESFDLIVLINNTLQDAQNRLLTANLISARLDTSPAK